MITGAQLLDSARHRRWTATLVKMALEAPGNAEAMQRWIAKWEPLADAAVDAYCAGFPMRRTPRQRQGRHAGVPQKHGALIPAPQAATQPNVPEVNP